MEKYFIDVTDETADAYGRRVYLEAADGDAAVEEAAGLDVADVGQIVDIRADGDPEPVAVSVDVEG